MDRLVAHCQYDLPLLHLNSLQFHKEKEFHTVKLRMRRL